MSFTDFSSKNILFYEERREEEEKSIFFDFFILFLDGEAWLWCCLRRLIFKEISCKVFSDTCEYICMTEQIVVPTGA